jgi:arginine utilization protein RocB
MVKYRYKNDRSLQIIKALKDIFANLFDTCMLIFCPIVIPDNGLINESRKNKKILLLGNVFFRQQTSLYGFSLKVKIRSRDIFM